MEIPQEQELIDYQKPEEHLMFFLRNMPTYAGVGAVTNFGFLKVWAQHLWKCGVVHRDYLVRLADEDGNIHISKLPTQTIRFQKAFRGPRHQFNSSARWVSADTPDPRPMVIPDVRQFTLEEQHAVKGMLEETGVVPTEKPKQHSAKVVKD